jgi:hypothetical protein
MFEQHKINDQEDQQDFTDQWWWSALVVLLIFGIVAFCPRSCNAKTIDCDTIPITWECVDTIFQKSSSSGKSQKFYIVFTYKGYKDITTTAKSTVEYIYMCKKYGITPKIALRCKKNGEIINVVAQKNRLRL